MYATFTRFNSIILLNGGRCIALKNRARAQVCVHHAAIPVVDHDNQVAAVRSLKCKVPGTANGRVGPPAEVKGPAPDSMSKVESLLPAEAYIIKALIADPTHLTLSFFKNGMKSFLLQPK